MERMRRISQVRVGSGMSTTIRFQTKAAQQAVMAANQREKVSRFRKTPTNVFARHPPMPKTDYRPLGMV
jgi:hypothetical protein